MKTTVTTLLATLTLLSSIHPAYAQLAKHEDGSQLAVWIFLGMCALIVVVQLLPLAFMTIGFLKGLAKRKQEEAPAPAEIPLDK